MYLVDESERGNSRLVLRSIAVLALVSLQVACTHWTDSPQPSQSEGSATTPVVLPEPRFESHTSLEQSLLERRSVRTYLPEPLELAQVSQLLWAAQGITGPDGLRTSPSAGALYPLEIYMLAGNVNSLAPGIYRYLPEPHALVQVAGGDQRPALHAAALEQDAILEAAAVIIISAVPDRTRNKYGDRGERYVHMEVGCVSQSIYLQAGALDLGTVFIGAFDDEAVRELLGAGEEQDPLGLMPVGKKRDE